VLNFLGNHWILDILDIAIVTILFYKLYIFIRSTRALTMFLGLLIIIAGGFLSEFLGLHGLNWIIGSLKTIWLIGFLIVFQPELRRALSTLGQNPLVRPFVSRTESDESVDVLVNASFHLAETRVGALMLLQGNAGLKGVIETGTPLYGQLSEELLVTIFQTKTPLHDGAVIISEGQIVAAGCILPLTQDTHLARTLGTRHRAGIGITEEADCTVIIVSEETGTVSLARGGLLQRNMTRESLRNALSESLAARESEAA